MTQLYSELKCRQVLEWFTTQDAWRPTWHQRNYLIFSEFNSLPFDQTMQYPGGKTTIIQRSRLHWRWVLSFGELGRRRFRENCRDLKMHPVCNLQPRIIFWPQTLSPVKRYLLLWKLCQCLSQMECLLDFGTYVSVWPHRLNTFEPLWSLFQQRGVLRWDNLAFLGKD